MLVPQDSFFFFFNDTATTEIYTLSLHDALPIWSRDNARTDSSGDCPNQQPERKGISRRRILERSEEHTSELQSPCNLVCRLLLEKKKNQDAYMRYVYNLVLLFAHHYDSPAVARH